MGEALASATVGASVLGVLELRPVDPARRLPPAPGLILPTTGTDPNLRNPDGLQQLCLSCYRLVHREMDAGAGRRD